MAAGWRRKEPGPQRRLESATRSTPFASRFGERFDVSDSFAFSPVSAATRVPFLSWFRQGNFNGQRRAPGAPKRERGLCVNLVKMLTPSARRRHAFGSDGQATQWTKWVHGSMQLRGLLETPCPCRPVRQRYGYARHHKSPPPRLAQPRISQLEAVPTSMQEQDANLSGYALLRPLHTAATVGDVFSP